MGKPKLFVSHISEELRLAAILKTHLSSDFLGLVEVFVSSDIESIAAGSNWLVDIERALREASVLIVLCSHSSVKRPWVNFEVGAAWIKSTP
jgi:TIR domain